MSLLSDPVREELDDDDPSESFPPRVRPFLVPLGALWGVSADDLPSSISSCVLNQPVPSSCPRDGLFSFRIIMMRFSALLAQSTLSYGSGDPLHSFGAFFGFVARSQIFAPSRQARSRHCSNALGITQSCRGFSRNSAWSASRWFVPDLDIAPSTRGCLLAIMASAVVSPWYIPWISAGLGTSVMSSMAQGSGECLCSPSTSFPTVLNLKLGPGPLAFPPVPKGSDAWRDSEYTAHTSCVHVTADDILLSAALFPRADRIVWQ